jgi:glycosyltransferase involved in cell wall biosynthesis
MPRRFFGASGMRDALRRELVSFDLVHVHGIWNFPGWLAIDACRKQGVPYVVSPRGMLDPGSLGHHRMRKALCYRFREKGNLRRASFLHATSIQEAASIGRLDLGPEIVVVPNGVDEPAFGERSDFRVRWGLPENARLVTFLGRLHPTKRLDLLVAAFQSLRSAVPDSVLVLAGRPDGVDPRSLGLGREIRWVGELEEDEKWKLLSETAVLVMCSDSESFGMSVLEALSAGVPVVATRTCPWEEIEAHGCGFWVAQDPKSLAESIRRILSDSTLARQMGARGRALAAERYRWPVIGREMARRYQRVCGKELGS